ncbi:MAG: hypothetical protein ACJ72Z_00565 [Pyrinomonadaceae bacterium]
MTPTKAEEKFKAITEQVRGKVVAEVRFHSANEISIDFSDGTSLYIDRGFDELEFTLTETSRE